MWNLMTQMAIVGCAMLGPREAAPLQDDGAKQQSRVARMLVESNDGEKELQVQILARDGKEDVIVHMNGKPVEGVLVQRQGKIVKVVDADGNVLATMPIEVMANVTPGEWMTDWQERGQTWSTFDVAMTDGRGLTWSYNTDQQPPVMLGVHLDEPSEAVLYHLGLETSEATQIGAVYESLPAHTAGIRLHDIIIAVDGNRAASPDDIRTALQQKAPGETIELTVIQKGEQRVLNVELVAYDRDRLFSTQVDATSVPFPHPSINWGTGNTVHGQRQQAAGDSTAQRGLTIRPDGRNRFFVGPDGKSGESNLYQFVPDIAIDPNAMIEIRPLPNPTKDDVAATLERIDERMKRLENLVEKLVEQR